MKTKEANKSKELRSVKWMALKYLLSFNFTYFDTEKQFLREIGNIFINYVIDSFRVLDVKWKILNFISC